jgi:hypothetical protein
VIPLKTIHPKITRMLPLSQLMKGQISKKVSQFFYNQLSRIVTFNFSSPKHLGLKSMQDVSCFHFISWTLFLNFKLALEWNADFVNGVLFLPCI